MRFHIGFSFRPSLTWLKWIGLGLVGLAAFFGIGNHAVLAATSGTVSLTPTTQGVYDYNLEASHTLSRSVGSSTYMGQRYYMAYSSATCGGGQDCPPVYSGYAFWKFPAKDFCPNKNKVTLTFKYFNRSSQGDYDFSSRNLSISGVWWYQVSSTFNSTGQFTTVTVTMDDDLPFEIRPGFNTSNYYYRSSGISQNFEYTCEYTLEESTSSIIDNNNQNTQQIIDSQNNINNSLTDSTISSDTSGGGTSFFGGFHAPSTNGFGSIITAPLRVFQTMVNNNACTPLTLPLKLADDNVSVQKNLTVPCGGILWDRAPAEVVSIWHILIFGLLAYRLLIDLVRFVNTTLNPEDTREYVMDL